MAQKAALKDGDQRLDRRYLHCEGDRVCKIKHPFAVAILLLFFPFTRYPKGLGCGLGFGWAEWVGFDLAPQTR